jgi:hypothetical protein
MCPTALWLPTTELLKNFVGVGTLDPLAATLTLNAGAFAVIKCLLLLVFRANGGILMP